MRIFHLKAMKEKWAAHLEQYPPSSEQHVHLAEALQDLDVLIQRLENGAGRDPAISVPMPAASVSIGA